ncbi:MAG: sialate O-acetylesterase [Pirellulaceae bacterium]
MTTKNSRPHFLIIILLVCGIVAPLNAEESEDDKTLRVFIFAGQSNMVGSDSKVKDIDRFPPFVGLEDVQEDVKFSYSIGRENKMESKGWVTLQPVNNIVGPELSFSRDVCQKIKAPIAIIKCAAGGTHLGGDWNPGDPSGFKMYPLALGLIQSSLAELDRQKIKYRIEGFMWHQGENDMFNKDYMPNYGNNLKNFVAKWRRDLETPELRFYIGELCTKTIWGMDLRPRMYAISRGQKEVTESDPLSQYVPTSHVGVEIGGGVGLHYHYGTLGQLQHGVNYATAYLRSIGKASVESRQLKDWPYKQGSSVKLFVLAGHRNMEGERAFIQELKTLPGRGALLHDNSRIAYKYSLGGGYKTSDSWEPLGPAGYYDTFGPELSFGQTLQAKISGNIAIAKFTHSGSQINDWTPQGSVAESRNIYPQFVAFIKEAIQELKDHGQQVELVGVFYHLGENDMSMPSYRKNAPQWLQSTIVQCRKDLQLPDLKWFVSQQPPTNAERVNNIDVTTELEKVASADNNFIHIKAFDLPKQEKKIVIDTAGIVQLGEQIAESYLSQQ